MTGEAGDASRPARGIRNETLGGLATVLPASKAEVRAKNAGLQAELANLQANNTQLKAEVATLQAGNAAEETLLNNLVLQVNKLTPVSTSVALFVPSSQCLAETMRKPCITSSCEAFACCAQEYNGTNGINGVNGTLGPAGSTGEPHHETRMLCLRIACQCSSPQCGLHNGQRCWVL